MKFSLFTENSPLNSPPIWQAVKQGLQNLNHTVNENDIDCDIPVIWSLLWHGRMAKNKIIWDRFKHKKILVIEVGGIQRNQTWKVALNGINRSADFGPKNNSNDRVKQFSLSVKPWRTQGENILLCLQHEKSDQWKDLPPLTTYVKNTVKEIRKHSKRKIIVRSHPRCTLTSFPILENTVYDTPKQIENTYDDFDLQFDNTWAVVSWSSNPGIHAVINGVPAFVGPHSLAYDVSNHTLTTIENPKLPDRQQWLNDYAYTEWTKQEIAQGTPFSRLTF